MSRSRIRPAGNASGSGASAAIISPHRQRRPRPRARRAVVVVAIHTMPRPVAGDPANQASRCSSWCGLPATAVVKRHPVRELRPVPLDNPTCSGDKVHGLRRERLSPKRLAPEGLPFLGRDSRMARKACGTRRLR